MRTQGVAALFSNTMEDPRLDLQTSSSIVSQSICAAMCVPIKSKEKLLGVLYLDNLRVPNRFTEEDLMFTASYANQAAVAIDRRQKALSSKLGQRPLGKQPVIAAAMIRLRVAWKPR